MWTSYQYSNYELYHHGIKGQKWGVRRYQNKDGTLTNAGKKRYSDDASNPKTSREDKYYRYYKVQGMSDIGAQKKAKGRVTTERVLTAVGAAAVTAAVAYVGYRYYDSHADRHISPSKIMQTVHRDDIQERLKPGSPFYATYTKADHTIYASKVFSHFGADSTVSRFYTKDGIKVASEKTGQKIYEELIKSNPEMAEYAQKISGIRGKKNAYGRFNYSLVLRNNSPTAKQLGLDGVDHDKFHNIFYNELKKRGYGAVMDINDKKIEGFTFNPVIVFDNQIKNVISSTKATSKQLSSGQTLKAAAYVGMKKKLRKPIDLFNPYTASGLAYVSLLGLDQAVESHKVNRSINYIDTYKRDHPNSKLTDKEILAMYNKK